MALTVGDVDLRGGKGMILPVLGGGGLQGWGEFCRRSLLGQENPEWDGLSLSLILRCTLSSTACGSLTRTLDSGIGTFPPPDHSSSGTPSKNLPKTKPLRLDPPPGAPPARPPGLTKVPRRAHTLEREVPGIEELLVSGRHPSLPAFPGLLKAPPGHRSHQTCPDGECPCKW